MQAAHWKRWTHDPKILTQVCLLLFLFFIGTALLGRWIGFYREELPNDQEHFASLVSGGDWDGALDVFKDVLSNEDITAEDWIFFTEAAGTAWGDHNATEPLAYLKRHKLKEILLPLWRASSTPPEDLRDPKLPLRLLAEKTPPPRYAPFAYAFWLYQRELWNSSAEAFAREAQEHDDSYSRTWQIHSLYQGEHYAKLEQLRSLPEYQPLFYASLLRDMALHRRDWLEAAFWLAPAEYENLDPSVLAMGVFTALVWLVICIQAAWSPAWKGPEFLLYAAAFLLGIMSTWPAVLWYDWSETVLGWTETGDTMGDALYCLLGIALPEETCKMLLYLPLLPFVLKVNRPLVSLMVPAFVGLGFGSEENLIYLQDNDFLTAISRFLTANFLHLSTTGLAGFALTRALQEDHRGWDLFFQAFGGVILAHGIYDAFLTAEALLEYFFVAPACLVFLAHFFFSELTHARGRPFQNFSLTATFVLGLTLLSGVSFHFIIRLHDPSMAFFFLGSNLLGYGPLIYMFIRETHEL